MRHGRSARPGHYGAAMNQRSLIWVSSGAASMVAARLALRKWPHALLVRCETNNEDEDNYRFERDMERFLNRTITIIKNEKYDSVPDLWEERKYMAGIKGAICTTEMKIVPRLAFQHPFDHHIFGYTADSEDIERFERLKASFPELTVSAPLISAGITKEATLAMVEGWGIALPRTYNMGFPNANCLQTGCVKATSPDYWSLLRKRFPDRFARTAKISRDLGVRLARIKGERVFIDEKPQDLPTLSPIVPACDFLCVLAEGNENESMP